MSLDGKCRLRVFLILLAVALPIGLVLNHYKPQVRDYSAGNIGEFQQGWGQLSEDMLDEMGSGEETDRYVPTERELELMDEFRRISKQHGTEIPVSDTEEYYDLIGPVFMLDVIEEEWFCHNKGHNLGKVVYKRSQNLGGAMQICQNRCNTGCFHGILMEFFKDFMFEDEHAHEEGVSDFHSHVSLEDISGQINSFCDQDIFVGGVTRGNCFHGMGHAFTFLSDYDLEKSVDICQLLEEKEAQYLCATGAYMERSIVYEDDNEADLFPCDVHRDFPAACYRYKLRKGYKDWDPEDVAQLCLGLEGAPQREGCFHGYGFMFYRMVKENPPFLAQLCSYGTRRERRMCIEAAAAKVRVSSKKIREKACNSLDDEELHEYCMEATNEKMIALYLAFVDPKFFENLGLTLKRRLAFARS